MMRKIAVILFNLGGPNSAEAVKPFLFNLFNDKSIINVPQPFRFLIAKLISTHREKAAIAAYNRIGGGSPILLETLKQAEKLEKILNKAQGKSGALYADVVFEKEEAVEVDVANSEQYKVFISMRYWHPFVEEILDDISKFNPDQIILLPLYPQFSTTTTASSFDSWKKAVRNTHLHKITTQYICCYFRDNLFIEAHASLILYEYKKFLNDDQSMKPRILFSAHGLPQKVIESGDPYQFQVEQTVAEIIRRLKQDDMMNDEEIDYIICYQSKVGPLKWLGPSTESEIIRAAFDKKPIIISPVAFVSEHLETLVELDMEYQEIAEKYGVEHYIRVSALGTDDNFMECLARICRSAANEKRDIINVECLECSQKFKCCFQSI